ncbi:MAG: hypothetical protein JWR26_2627 [Pedosphaera sp.]|nr:hypothetical protein [Pedosphaera sp.]
MKIFDSIKKWGVLWVWNHAPHCNEMSRLASQSLDHPLPLKIRLKMRLHFLICIWCKRYSKQLRVLHHTARRVKENLTQVTRPGLSEEAKARMKARLKSGLI